MIPALRRAVRGPLRCPFGEASSSRQTLRRVQLAVRDANPAWATGVHTTACRKNDRSNDSPMGNQSSSSSEAEAEAPRPSNEGAAEAGGAPLSEAPVEQPPPLDASPLQSTATTTTSVQGDIAGADTAATSAAEPPPSPPLSASTMPGLGLPESVRAPQPGGRFGSDSAGRGGMSGSGGVGAGTRSAPFSLSTSEPFHLHIQSTRNNTILTLTTPQGSPITNVSCGTVGFRKGARSSYDAAYRTAMTMFSRIEENRVSWRLATLELVWNGFGQGREAVFRALQTDDGTYVRNLVRRMRDATSIKIGGVRPRKRRSECL